ncbi:MAG: TrbI/VirB10 family protein [Rickettsiales bacterium]|nr:TrbI/VirB10 family protein [Rickettsiales bacterium]
MVDKENKNFDDGLDDDLDEDLLDDLGDPLVASNKPTKSKKSDSDPLDDEKKGNLLGKIFGKKNKIEQAKKIEDTLDPTSNNNDELLDETPKVSMAAKKNIIVIVAASLILVYFVHAITKDKKNKKVNPKTLTEIEEMKQEFREEAKIPTSGKDKANETEADKQKIAEIQSKVNDPLAAIDVVSAPPPPPPTTYDPGEIFTKENEPTTNQNSDINFDDPVSGLDDEFDDEFAELDDLEFEEEEENPKKSKSAAVNFLVGQPQKNNNNNGGNQSSASNLPTLNSGAGVAGTNNNGNNPVAQDIQQQLSANMFTVSAAEELPQEFREDPNNNLDGGLGGGEPFNINQGIAVVGDRQQPYQLRDSTNNRRDVQIVRDMNNIILQGKVLDAIIETAINTDLPGKLRGVVARDVYAENGKKILIPKGSRLIGTYDTQIRFGQARVYIIWTRVIRPDGIDVVLDSREDMIAVDLLGRTGVTGNLDNRFTEIFGSSILLSTLTVAFAYLADSATEGARDITTTVTENGNVVESGPNLSIAARQGVTDLANNLQRLARDSVDTRPRITIDQGTRIKVFVNKDLRFPPNFATNFKDEEVNEVMILR